MKIPLSKTPIFSMNFKLNLNSLLFCFGKMSYLQYTILLTHMVIYCTIQSLMNLFRLLIAFSLCFGFSAESMASAICNLDLDPEFSKLPEKIQERAQILMLAQVHGADCDFTSLDWKNYFSKVIDLKIKNGAIIVTVTDSYKHPVDLSLDQLMQEEVLGTFTDEKLVIGYSPKKLKPELEKLVRAEREGLTVTFEEGGYGNYMGKVSNLKFNNGSISVTIGNENLSLLTDFTVEIAHLN